MPKKVIYSVGGRGGCPRVSALAFYSDYPSSIPAGYLNFLYEKMKINEKEAGVGPSLKKLFTQKSGKISFNQGQRCHLPIMTQVLPM